LLRGGVRRLFVAHRQGTLPGVASLFENSTTSKDLADHWPAPIKPVSNELHKQSDIVRAHR
jgi:hypothetical protein